MERLRVPTGRPGYPPLADRLSFRCFCGFGQEDATPDETTLCRFRGTLAERGLAEMLFAEVNRQLDARGLMLKAGTLIDATLVEAAVARPPASEGGVSTKDPEAGFTRRGRKSLFGFKAHVAVDLGSAASSDAAW
jgi:IS5 family transposase